MWKGLRGSECDEDVEVVGGTVEDEESVVVVVSMASARAVVNVEKREVAKFVEGEEFSEGLHATSRRLSEKLISFES